MATKRSPTAEQLRTDSEVELFARTPLAGAIPRQADAMLHELQVHQVEPEMQNESLRQTQITLEESRDRYAALYDTAPVGYLTLNTSGLIAEIDLTGAALLGEDRSRLVNSCFANFVASRDQDAWYLYFLHASEHCGMQTCELSLQRKDGTVFEARLDCLPTEADDTVASLHISLFDITGIKRAIVEDQLGELRLRQFIECTPDAMVVVDAKGIINTVNRRTETLFGYDLKELHGQPVEILIPNRLRSAHVAHRNSYLVQVQAQGMNKNADLLAVTREGREFPVDISLGPLETGSGRIVVVTIRDITENRRLMTELQASEARMRLAQISAKIGIYDSDMVTSRFFHWDEQLRKMWGFGLEDPVTFADILQRNTPTRAAHTCSMNSRTVFMIMNGSVERARGRQ